MNIRFIVVGKNETNYLQTGIEEYLSRLRHYCEMEMVVVPTIKNSSSLTADELKEREGAQIMKLIDRPDCTILLDEHGEEYTSMGFSTMLQKQMNAGVRRLTFVVGGAYGFAPTIYATVKRRMSLSKMTFNHQMVRLFFLEQLYRAHTILRHEKYHNE